MFQQKFRKSSFIHSILKEHLFCAGSGDRWVNKSGKGPYLYGNPLLLDNTNVPRVSFPEHGGKYKGYGNKWLKH